MATTEFIAAIELGSSKITGVAGRKNSDGSMQILAYAQEDSSTFIRKGVIFNLDKTAQSLTSIINRLEGELKNSIAKVYVGIGGQSLRTVRNVVSRDLEEEAIISEELVSQSGGTGRKPHRRTLPQYRRPLFRTEESGTLLPAGKDRYCRPTDRATGNSQCRADRERTPFGLRTHRLRC